MSDEVLESTSEPSLFSVQQPGSDYFPQFGFMKAIKKETDKFQVNLEFLASSAVPPPKKTLKMVTTRSGARKSAGPSPESSFVLVDAIGHGSGNGYSNGNPNTRKRIGEASVDVSEHDSKRQKVAEPVDKTRWRMKADGGRHTWHYVEDDQSAKDWPQSHAEKWYLDLPLVSPEDCAS